jgi:hypothetical protein
MILFGFAKIPYPAKAGLRGASLEASHFYLFDYETLLFSTRVFDFIFHYRNGRKTAENAIHTNKPRLPT